MLRHQQFSDMFSHQQFLDMLFTQLTGHYMILKMESSHHGKLGTDVTRRQDKE